MKVGQISNRYNKYSRESDYLQFDICGLNNNQAIEKLHITLDKNPHIKEILFHSDWSKKGVSENDFPNRINSYIEIYNSLSKFVKVTGITLHPMFRNKITQEDFLDKVSYLEQHMNVFIENRSNDKILFSTPQEVIDLSKIKKMTIDIPQLLIASKYTESVFVDTLNNIDWNNVYEVHLANLQRKENRTFVGRQLDDGIIDIKKISKYLQGKYITLEILGGCNIFNENKIYLNNIVK